MACHGSCYCGRPLSDCGSSELFVIETIYYSGLYFWLADSTHYLGVYGSYKLPGGLCGNSTGFDIETRTSTISRCGNQFVLRDTWEYGDDRIMCRCWYDWWRHIFLAFVDSFTACDGRGGEHCDLRNGHCFQCIIASCRNSCEGSSTTRKWLTYLRSRTAYV